MAAGSRARQADEESRAERWVAAAKAARGAKAPPLMPGLAAVFSFVVPGSGLLYCGRLWRGIAVSFGLAVLLALAIWLLSRSIGAADDALSIVLAGSLLLIWLIAFLWQVFLAYETAKDINEGELEPD